jgi:hypothetical protein
MLLMRPVLSIKPFSILSLGLERSQRKDPPFLFPFPTPVTQLKRAKIIHQQSDGEDLRCMFDEPSHLLRRTFARSDQQVPLVLTRLVVHDHHELSTLECS